MLATKSNTGRIGSRLFGKLDSFGVCVGARLC